MKFFRRIFKIFALTVWSSALMLPAAISMIGLKKWAKVRRGARWAQIWARGAAAISGGRIRLHGDVPEGCGALLVSNHLGYLDILAHASVFRIRFTPKAEIRKWFFAGPLVALSAPIWIDRRATRRAAEYAATFRETMLNGVSLLVYPEGTSSDGKHGLLPFKSTPFASLPQGTPIIPMVLFYREAPPDDAPGAWFDDTPFPTHVWGVLGLRSITIDLFVMPPMQAEAGEERKELAARVRNAMTAEYDRHAHRP